MNLGTTTILMRTKDRPLFLKRALQSVLAQTNTSWNLQLINDGGNLNDLKSSLLPFEEKLGGRLNLVHFPLSEGRGKGKHLNAGLQNSLSDFVAIHDDDDSWHPQFLEKMISSLGEKHAIVSKSFSVMEEVKNDGIEEISRAIHEPWQTHGVSLFRLAESLSFPPIALLFRRSVLQHIGAFDDELGPLEDWEFSLRLLARYECGFLEEALANYHQRKGASGSDANSTERAKEIYGRLDLEIRNRLLRQDLAQGRLGLGYLVNMAQSHGRLVQELRSP